MVTGENFPESSLNIENFTKIVLSQNTSQFPLRNRVDDLVSIQLIFFLSKMAICQKQSLLLKQFNCKNLLFCKKNGKD